jgi:hypothetical protein
MGYVYKYTHKENGKWYIGSHNGNKENYTGSGLLWQKAKSKYGIDSYNFEILYEGEMYREEEESILKSLNAADDDMSYNMKNEALGGSFPGEKNGMYGKTLNQDQRYKCGSAFRGKKRPDHAERMKGESNPRFGKNDHTHGLAEFTAERRGKTNDDFYGADKAKEIAQKIADGNRGKPKPGTSKANTGAGNPSAKRVIIDGIEYGCIKDAMETLGLSRYKILKMVK